MDFLAIMIIIIFALVKGAASNGDSSSRSSRKTSTRTSTSSTFGHGPTKEEWTQKVEEARKAAVRAGTRTVEWTTKRPPTGKQIEAEQKRQNDAERRHSERRWAEARRQQEDAFRVHAAGVDSCEGRLESLKVLYEAGILDREEYTQRVARVKAQHSHR